jgi:transposase
MSSVTRRSFTPQQKAEIVRRHLVGKEAVSNLATEFLIQPSQIHTWVKLVLDQAAAAFQRQPGNRRADDGKDRRIAKLEEKLVQKNEVIAELLEENVRSKKANGDL